MVWWTLWFGSIVAQCNPIAMHLAPHMRVRARRVIIVVWAAITLMMTLAVGVPIGYPGRSPCSPASR
ncbi:hypothetical protein CR103_17525 [Massilia psychrophila]|jgi:hypothetical protein|uniref:Uncharacterized protein n=1 Tax=Massilia psychrophila TaxID=1603353 RepID=A0A2G8SXP6_9BURK|nr:hypothetical protein CR103_17525 [Massilia psychrophila]